MYRIMSTTQLTLLERVCKKKYDKQNMYIVYVSTVDQLVDYSSSQPTKIYYYLLVIIIFYHYLGAIKS